MHKVYCALGSNVGDRIAFLKKAIEALNKAGFIVGKISNFYETAPMGNGEAAEKYINAVVELETSCELPEFHKRTKLLEKEIGRRPTYRWGPREIDIDILLFDDLTYSDEKLTIPHKGMRERDFVLVPLFEIAGDIKIPRENKFLSELINNLQNHYILRKI